MWVSNQVVECITFPCPAAVRVKKILKLTLNRGVGSDRMIFKDVYAPQRERLDQIYLLDSFVVLFPEFSNVVYAWHLDNKEEQDFRLPNASFAIVGYDENMLVIMSGDGGNPFGEVVLCNAITKGSSATPVLDSLPSETVPSGKLINICVDNAGKRFTVLSRAVISPPRFYATTRSFTGIVFSVVACSDLSEKVIFEMPQPYLRSSYPSGGIYLLVVFARHTAEDYQISKETRQLCVLAYDSREKGFVEFDVRAPKDALCKWLSPCGGKIYLQLNSGIWTVMVNEWDSFLHERESYVYARVSKLKRLKGVWNRAADGTSSKAKEYIRYIVDDMYLILNDGSGGVQLCKFRGVHESG